MNKIILYDQRLEEPGNEPWNRANPILCEDSILGITDAIIGGKAKRIISVDFSGNVCFNIKPTLPDSQVQIYVSSHGNLCRKEYHKDGVNHTIFRSWKPHVTEEQKKRIRGKIYSCDVDAAEILQFTRPIGQWVLDHWWIVDPTIDDKASI